MPKLLNIINAKMVPYIKENKLIMEISLDMHILFSDTATVDRLQCIRYICSLPTYVFRQ